MRLRDIAKDSDLYNKAIQEEVTRVSFLRSLSETTIIGQFRRLAKGGSKLSRYSFNFILSPVQDVVAPLQLEFVVEPESDPPTNIHVLIGRNGVGKTFVINNMIEALTPSPDHSNALGKFISANNEERLFANLICVTFSAFDEFDHQPEQRDKSKGLPYNYIGLKAVQEQQQSSEPRNPTLLRDDFVRSIIACKNNSRVSRWKRAISILESDPIFRSAAITSLIDDDSDSTIKDTSAELFRRLSSGHKIILLTITRLVETIQERSLVLFDEPESHLHPPLLSSFINAVSDLLINRNGVAIIATHSLVILQEVPRSCVWKLRRNGAEAISERLEIESFGENVGVLTQEVFGLEVTDSGFHRLLKRLVDTNTSYNEAVETLQGQIGLEAKSILRSLFYQKEKTNESNT